MSATAKKVLWIVIAVIVVAFVIYGIVALGAGSGAAPAGDTGGGY